MDDVAGGQPLENDNLTIDVTRQCCFESYDVITCARSGSLSLVMAVTALFCAVRVFQLHHEKHPQLHHYLIFYAATTECIISAAYWSCGKQFPRIDFVQSCLKLMQFVIICHFYWCLAMRIIHKEALVNRVVIPILALYGGYFAAVAALGMWDVKSSWIECLEPEWLFLSAAEFLAVQLFAVAGVYITKKLNQISSDETFKSGQKRDLWSVIIVYEMSAFLSLAYDSVMRFLGDNQIGCSGIFGHDQMSYSLIFAVFMTMKFILPIWITLCVFHPLPSQAIDPESVFGWSFVGPASTSVFRPRGIRDDGPYCRQFCFRSGSPANQAAIDGLPFGKEDGTTDCNQGYASGYVGRLQSALTPITEEDGGTEPLEGSEKSSSILYAGLAIDNRPLLTNVTSSKPC